MGKDLYPNGEISYLTVRDRAMWDRLVDKPMMAIVELNQQLGNRRYRRGYLTAS